MHRRPSQIIAIITSKIAAVWPVCCSWWNVSIFSCDGNHCDGYENYLEDNCKSSITGKPLEWPSLCCKPFENQTLNSWDIPKSGAKLPTCWKMHRKPSHVVLLHRRSFRTSHRRCAASQRVAGPIGTYRDCHFRTEFPPISHFACF